MKRLLSLVSTSVILVSFLLGGLTFFVMQKSVSAGASLFVSFLVFMIVLLAGALGEKLTEKSTSSQISPSSSAYPWLIRAGSAVKSINEEMKNFTGPFILELEKAEEKALETYLSLEEIGRSVGKVEKVFSLINQEVIFEDIVRIERKIAHHKTSSKVLSPKTLSDKALEKPFGGRSPNNESPSNESPSNELLSNASSKNASLSTESLDQKTWDKKDQEKTLETSLLMLKEQEATVLRLQELKGALLLKMEATTLGLESLGIKILEVGTFTQNTFTEDTLGNIEHTSLKSITSELEGLRLGIIEAGAISKSMLTNL